MRTAQIAIAGGGYVGLTSAACFCEMGHQVTLVEIDPERLALLQSAQCPICEPGLPELLRKHLGHNLFVTDQLAQAMDGSSALFACVGTPSQPGGAPNLSALRRLLQQLKDSAPAPNTILVMKSTVPLGTNRMVYEFLRGRLRVVSNPEFLREGTAIHDFFHPDRIVVGSPDEEAALTVAGLYVGMDAPLLVTGWPEAELIKYATNAFLAAKISFANEIAALCDALGADAQEVMKGLGLDARVGPHFLRPGPGYGGSCLPKDVKGLLWMAKQVGVRLDLIPAAERANSRQRHRLLAKLFTEVGPLSGRTVAIWGLAFKAGTDDLRGAAAVELVPRILGAGARIQAFDPVAMKGFSRMFPPDRWPGLQLTPSQDEALYGAEALLILTEWDSFRVQPQWIATRLSGNVVIDGRNLIDPDESHKAGLRYHGVGRGRGNRARVAE